MTTQLTVRMIDAAGADLPVRTAPGWPAAVAAGGSGGDPAAGHIEVTWVGPAPSADGPTGPEGEPCAMTAVWRGESPVLGHLVVELDLPAADPWWLIPGAFYGENRPAECERLFPRFEIGADDPESMVSDSWSFRADRAATPAVFAWGDDGAIALVTGETSPIGLSGLGFAHTDRTATVHLVFPFREDPVTYYGSATPRPAERSPHRFEPGEPVTVTWTTHRLGADRHGYAPVLRAVHAAAVPQAPVNPWMDVETAADLTADGLFRWHYDPDPGVLLETVGFDRGIEVDGRSVDRQAMHVGWVSGLPWSYALLRHGLRVGRPEHVAAAARVTDFICDNLSPSGTFWGTWYREHGWSQSWTTLPGGLHARTLGEATHFLVRSIVAERSAGREHAGWLRAARSNLAVLAGRQRPDGNLGAVHDARTGEVLRWVGAAGLAWIPAFVEATEAGLGHYLEPAIRAGEYYSRFVDREFLHGAPEDVDLAPTSEDGYAAIMAYMALHRATGEDRWVDLARRAADWTLTFRYTYNVAFEPHTLLGAYGFATRGADQASPSNQHLHDYGLICTRELVELSAATGDPHYADRAEETLACFRQFVARQDGDFNAYRGMVSERYYQTSCFQPKGMLLTLSHSWCVGAVLLACEDWTALGRPR